MHHKHCAQQWFFYINKDTCKKLTFISRYNMSQFHTVCFYQNTMTNACQVSISVENLHEFPFPSQKSDHTSTPVTVTTNVSMLQKKKTSQDGNEMKNSCKV